jgi:ABC-type phosphate transport system auxiliary subunit
MIKFKQREALPEEVSLMQEMLLPLEESDDTTQKPQPHLLKLASAAETRAPRDVELIARLQKEIAILQTELEKSRNEVARYEVLLRNAQQRERELRAEMNGSHKP